MSQQAPVYEVRPTSRFRRVAAKRLRASVVEKPPVTLHRTVDVTQTVELVDSLKREASGEARPSLTSVLAVLTARALHDDPTLNAHLVDNELRRFPDVHLAVAVATDDGLVAPVLRPTDLTDHVGAARRLREIAREARRGSLRPEDLAAATFTLTSLGAWDVEYFTPILNPPQIGILGVGAIAETSRGAGDESRRQLPLSLTFDHAATDGVDGARFLQTLAELLADPLWPGPTVAAGMPPRTGSSR